jgi:hypothetical protein
MADRSTLRSISRGRGARLSRSALLATAASAALEVSLISHSLLAPYTEWIGLAGFKLLGTEGYRRTVLRVPGEVLVQIAVGGPGRDPLARARAWIDVGSLGVREHQAETDGLVRFTTFVGDRIRVAAAVDADGRGTMMSAGLN